MERNEWSDYEKYLVMADNSGKLGMTYDSYLEFLELTKLMKRLATSSENQFLFGRNMYNREIPQSRAKTAMYNIQKGTFDPIFQRLAKQVHMRLVF